MGRAVGILIADGSDGAVIERIKKAATDAGATVKIIAPKVGGVANGVRVVSQGPFELRPASYGRAKAFPSSTFGAVRKAIFGAAPFPIQQWPRMWLVLHPHATKTPPHLFKGMPVC